MLKRKKQSIEDSVRTNKSVLNSKYFRFARLYRRARESYGIDINLFLTTIENKSNILRLYFDGAYQRSKRGKVVEQEREKMATPRIQGYTSQKNYDYYQEAYTAYMAKRKESNSSGTFIIEAIKSIVIIMVSKLH